jgi:DNA-binding NtrC family response regulator
MTKAIVLYAEVGDLTAEPLPATMGLLRNRTQKASNWVFAGRQAVTQRILVVDDEPSIRHLLQLALAEEHYHVETAGTALEALERLEFSPFDLAIVDLLLPGLNGLHLAEAIRMLDPGTPVILMTAYGTSAFESIAVHPAISHYLHKPFALDRLLALVGQVFGYQSHMN